MGCMVARGVKAFQPVLAPLAVLSRLRPDVRQPPCPDLMMPWRSGTLDKLLGAW